MQTFLFTSTQFITYPVQTSDSSLFSLFSRFLTPYNPSTYSPSIAFLFHTNARLTPPSIAFLLLTYSHSIAFLSTYNPPTYSPSVALLSAHKCPTYSPSIDFLLTYSLYSSTILDPSSNVLLTPYNRPTYPIQSSDLLTFKHLTYSIQTSVKPNFN